MPRLLRYVMAERSNFIHCDYTAEADIFVLLEDGKFTFECDGGKFCVNAGDGAYFSKGTHYLRNADLPLKMHLFRFESDTNVFLGSKISFINKQRIFSDIDILNRLNDDIYRDNFEYTANIFCDIANLYRFENSISGDEKKIKDELVASAIKYMNENFFRNEPLTSLAEKQNISYVRFLNRFKNQTGMTPYEYTARLKMKKAEELLVNTNLAVKEISALCGFENEYYFSNFFKKQSGVSPSKFRADASVM